MANFAHDNQSEPDQSGTGDRATTGPLEAGNPLRDRSEEERWAKPAANAELSLRELVPYMPPGMRSISTIKRMVKEHKLPGHKPGAQWYFVWGEVKRALELLDQRRDAVGALLVRDQLVTMPVALIDLLAKKPRPFKRPYHKPPASRPFAGV